MNKKKDSISWKEAFPLFLNSIKRVWQIDKKYVIITCAVFSLGAIPELSMAFATAVFNQRIVLGIEKFAGYFSVCYPLLVAFSISLIYSVSFSLWRWVETKSIEKITGVLLYESSKKAEMIDYASYDSPEFYDKISNGWAQDGKMFVHSAGNVFNCVKDLLGTVMHISVLAYVDWKLMLAITIIRILVNPFINKTYVLTYQLNKKLASIRRKETYYKNFFGNREMSAEGKLFGLYNYAEDNYLKAHSEIYKVTFVYKLKLSLIRMLSNVIYYFPLIIGYIYLSICVFYSTVSLADMTLFISMYVGFVDQVYNTISRISSFRDYAEQSRHAREFLALPTTIFDDNDQQKACPKRDGGHTFTFKNVTFRYPGTECTVLNNVSFTVKENETVSIIGANGAGKTTLIHLLMRLYDPTDGVILLDNRDIREYSVKQLNLLFGVLFQDYCSYPFNAEESISLSTDQYDSEYMEKILKKSTAGKFIAHLKEGLKTPLSRRFANNGVELSGGQKQRIALARAYYRNAQVEILDEPSASIDPQSESDILQEIKGEYGKKNIFIISHRLSTCIFSDRILFFKDGELIGNGTHDMLLESNAEYARMFNLQAGKYGAEI